MSNTTPTTTNATADDTASKRTQTAKPAAPKDSKAAKEKSAASKTVKANTTTKASKAPKAPKTAKAKPVKPESKVKTKAKTKPEAKAPAAPASKTPKVKKPKLVRDSFTMPKDEYAAIQTLKTRSTALAQPAKKSELLRAGIKLLAGLNDKALLTALKAIPTLKTGRPAKS